MDVSLSNLHLLPDQSSTLLFQYYSKWQSNASNFRRHEYFSLQYLNKIGFHSNEAAISNHKLYNIIQLDVHKMSIKEIKPTRILTDVLFYDIQTSMGTSIPIDEL